MADSKDTSLNEDTQSTDAPAEKLRERPPTSPSSFGAEVVRVPLTEHDHVSDEPSSRALFLAKLLDDNVWVYRFPPIDAKYTTPIRYVVDGELCEAWSEPSQGDQYVRDVDLSRGQRLLELLSETLAVADRDMLDRLPKAIGVLENRPTTEGKS
ncbi:MAG TPA: hypothetical protein VNO21_23390 [Polyangiaceae bacterium]|nr:hypothetical protein [Polyangiaceae bacterium]